MPFTPKGIWYPSGTDLPNVPADMKLIAESFDRRIPELPLQEGVAGHANAFLVTQRAVGGANMSVDVATDLGYAYVKGDTGSFDGLWPVKPFGVATNLSISSNASGNPRVDSIVVELLSADPWRRVRVVQGNSNAAANLSSRTGAPGGGSGPVIPDNAFILADVLVANGAATIPNSAIRDRRKWAMGAKVIITRNANGAGTSSVDAAYSITNTTSLTYIDSTNLLPRIECSGVPVRVTLVGVFTSNVITAHYVEPMVDGLGVLGMPNLGSNPSAVGGGHQVDFATVNSHPMSHLNWTFVPSAGSHQIGPAWSTSAANTFGVYANATRPLQLIIEEDPRLSAANNTVTTG